MFLEIIDISKILYLLTLIILTSGLFLMLVSDNYVGKIIGLSIMQSSVLVFYLILGKVNNGVIPIDCSSSIIQSSDYKSDNNISSNDKAPLEKNLGYRYSNPLPQVLMLTAIVVGFATLSLGLSLIYRISKQFGTISECKINFSKND